MKFSIISLASLVALAPAMPTTADPKVEAIETLERRADDYQCATPHIWYDNSGKSSAWADECAGLADMTYYLLVNSGWNKIHTSGSCVLGLRKLNTGHFIQFGSDDIHWLITESLKKFRTGDDGLGVQGEWKCERVVGGKADVQFWIGHENDW